MTVKIKNVKDFKGKRQMLLFRLRCPAFTLKSVGYKNEYWTRSAFTAEHLISSVSNCTIIYCD